MKQVFLFVLIMVIPHYEMVDREGQIMRKRIRPYTIEASLNELLEKEKAKR